MVSGSNRLPVTAPQRVSSHTKKISSRNRREEIFLFCTGARKRIYNRPGL